MQLDSVLPPSFICTEQISPARERETKSGVSDRETEIERVSLRGDDKTEGGGGGEAARCSIKELQRPPRAGTQQPAAGI